MLTRTAEADWDGTLDAGRGMLHLPHGPGTGDEPYSARSRFTDQGQETNPEELIAAAHAGCFSMALSLQLEQAGYVLDHVHTRAKVYLDRDAAGYFIKAIDLDTEARVPGMDASRFQDVAEQAKRGCPVSRALAVPNIRLQARLL
jgi:osmotically inducible protein OsmC